MTDLLTTISIILAVSSATLAITALIFSFIFFKATSKIQMDTQDLLSKVSEKAEVIVKLTSNQMDKAWDYFLNQPILSSKTDVIKEELNTKIVKETKKEAIEAIGKVGINKSEIDKLLPKVEDILNRSNERFRLAYTRHLLATKLNEIDKIVRIIANIRGIDKSLSTPFKALLEKMKGFFIRGAEIELEYIAEFVEMSAKNNLNLTLKQADRALSMVDRLIEYLHQERNKIFHQQIQ